MKKIVLLLLATATAVNMQASPFVTTKPLFEEQFITLSSGVTLEYVEQGNKNGTPVIFLHGLSDSWRSFETVLPHLPASIHAFAISQRGHGDSDRPESGYAPSDFAADVAAFIFQKKLGRVIIAGHSMGGVNAQQFALQYPHLVKAVVIIDSDPVFRDNKGMPEFLDEVSKMKTALTREYLSDFQKATLYKPIDSNYFKTVVEESMKCPLPVFYQALQKLMETDFTPQLKMIKAPVKIFWADKDGFCFKRGQDVFVRNIKHAKFSVYKDTGHALHWEQPERFAKEITRFIKGI